VICYKDRAFCVSPGCTNACGRKLTPEVEEAARKWWGRDDPPVAVGEFCPQPPAEDSL
jgi:hypothetical protein